MKMVFSRFLLLLFTFVISLNIAHAFDDDEDEGSTASAREGQTFYTQTNIWYEKQMKILILFHAGAVLPVGTKVTISDVSSKALEFSTKDGGEFRIYTQKYYKLTGEEMAALLFGKKNPKAKGGKFYKFSKMERRQIEIAELKKGMSREAAIMAYGYPPTHANPDIKRDTWKLWVTRWNKMNVYFKNGKISRIQD